MGQIRKYVYLDSVREADIIDWLSSQPSQSSAIKMALCAWVRDGKKENDGVDYTAIRQIIDAALDARFSGIALVSSDAPNDEDGEMEALLEELKENVLL